MNIAEKSLGDKVIIALRKLSSERKVKHLLHLPEFLELDEDTTYETWKKQLKKINKQSEMDHKDAAIKVCQILAPEFSTKNKWCALLNRLGVEEIEKDVSRLSKRKNLKPEVIAKKIDEFLFRVSHDAGSPDPEDVIEFSFEEHGIPIPDVENFYDYHTQEDNNQDYYENNSRENEAQQSREKNLELLRQKNKQSRERNAKARQEEFAKEEKRRKKVENEIKNKVENQSSGFWGSLVRGVKCTIGHKGEWFWVADNLCKKTRMCERCGKVKEDIVHTWEDWQRIIKEDCEFIQFCSRCGSEQIVFKHDWEWEYLHTNDCEQQLKCDHCQEIDSETRIKHNWGKWSDSGHASYYERTCKRCKEKEVKEKEEEENDSYWSGSESSGGYKSKKKLANLSGTWVDNFGQRLKVQHKGNRISIQGFNNLGTVVMQGQGHINGNYIQMGYWYFDGVLRNQGRTDLEVSTDGRMMAGYLHSMNGNSYMELYKQ